MISMENLVKKHAAYVEALDPNKTCSSCAHHTPDGGAGGSCIKCYNELLGMPVNPTNWEVRQ